MMRQSSTWLTTSTADDVSRTSAGPETSRQAVNANLLVTVLLRSPLEDCAASGSAYEGRTRGTRRTAAATATVRTGGLPYCVSIGLAVAATARRRLDRSCLIVILIGQAMATINTMAPGQIQWRLSRRGCGTCSSLGCLCRQTTNAHYEVHRCGKGIMQGTNSQQTQCKAIRPAPQR